MKNLAFLFLCLFTIFFFACDPPQKAIAADKSFENECIDPNKVNPNQPCTREYRPVCGCDGKTYSNPCLAKSAGLKSWEEGKCGEGDCIDQKMIKKDAACPENCEPVCGCDGKTYSNTCFAKIAGVTKWTEGPCAKACIDETKKEPERTCTREYRPVCGCDGKVYSNQCEAEKAGVVRFSYGECHPCQDPSKIGTAKIQRVMRPVCGCDGKTYDNYTLAENAGLKKWTKGKCEDCIKTEGVKKVDCPDNWEPVCGCNNKTYGNECQAKVAGVQSWTKGECPK